MAIKHHSTRAKRPLLLGSAEPITVAENIPHPDTLEGVLARRREVVGEHAGFHKKPPMNWYAMPVNWVFLRGRSGYPTPDITVSQAIMGPQGEVEWDLSEVATLQGTAEHYEVWKDSQTSGLGLLKGPFTYGQRKKRG